MDIWIRSQDKQELIKIDYIEANMGRIFIQYGPFRKCWYLCNARKSIRNTK